MSLRSKPDRVPLTTSGVTAVDNGTAMRSEDVQDLNRPRAAEDLGSTLVADRRVTVARKKRSELVIKACCREQDGQR